VSNLYLRSGLSASTPCVFHRGSLSFAGIISRKRHDLVTGFHAKGRLFKIPFRTGSSASDPLSSTWSSASRFLVRCLVNMRVAFQIASSVHATKAGGASGYRVMLDVLRSL
jgi:hypothetical protein